MQSVPRVLACTILSIITNNVVFTRPCSYRLFS